ncbi:MAG: hypothetical protein AAF823_16265, partial [Planctomycetota bacterium]
ATALWARPGGAAIAVAGGGAMPRGAGLVVVAMNERGGHLFVPAEVNGRAAGMWLLDTGAGVDAIGMGLSGRLNLPREGRGAARGIGGVEAFDYVMVDRWGVGGVEMGTDRLARLNVHRFSRGTGVSMQGIAGFAGLRGLDFAIDYPAGELWLGPAGWLADSERDAGGRSVAVRIRGGVPRVRVVPEGGAPIELVLDTGANGGIAMPRAYLLRYPEVVAVGSLSASASRGVGGTSRQHATWLRAVEVFGVRMEGVAVRFEEGDGSATIGRVGYDVLRHFRLAFSEGGTRLTATYVGEEVDDGR